MNYSQHNEEELINKYVGDIEKGIYVDIGAGNAEEYSNTYALYLKGWRGILVEPFPIHKYHESIREKRSEDKLCIKAITNRVGKLKMLDTASIETVIGQDYARVGKRVLGDPHYAYEADCYTMKEFLEEFPEAKLANFASIDIETGEEALLSCCDFNIFKPKLICIEYTVRGVDYRPRWEHYLLPFYEAKELRGGNAFYLRKS